MMEWLEKLAQAPGVVAFGALALASAIEAGLLAVGADFLVILVIAARPDNWIVVAAVASLGSIAGTWIGHVVGRGVGRPLIQRILPDSWLIGIEGAYARHDLWVMAVSGLLPMVPYKHISLTAGFFNVDRNRLLVASGISRTLRFVALAYLAMIYRDGLRVLLVEHGLAVLVGIILLAVVVEVVRRMVFPTGAKSES